MLGGVELDGAVAVSVSRDDELAADVDVARRELRVVVGQAVVHVHNRRGHIARGGVRDEARSESRILRIAIDRRCRLGHSKSLGDGRDDVDGHGRRERQVRLILNHFDVETRRGERASDGLRNIALRR